jgi:hypothetical protein
MPLIDLLCRVFRDAEDASRVGIPCASAVSRLVAVRCPRLQAKMPMMGKITVQQKQIVKIIPRST